jgi:cation diffusion facilitator CzcD-associated flavoprotein CzcO
MGSMHILENREPFQLQHQPLGTHRPIRVVCIGAGYSGLMMAIVVEQKMKKHNVDFQIYERENDLGGTWLVNRYVSFSILNCQLPQIKFANIEHVDILDVSIIE